MQLRCAALLAATVMWPFSLASGCTQDFSRFRFAETNQTASPEAGTASAPENMSDTPQKTEDNRVRAGAGAGEAGTAMSGTTHMDGGVGSDVSGLDAGTNRPPTRGLHDERERSHGAEGDSDADGDGGISARARSRRERVYFRRATSDVRRRCSSQSSRFLPTDTLSGSLKPRCLRTNFRSAKVALLTSYKSLS